MASKVFGSACWAIGDNDVFRLTDGTLQFRMTGADNLGHHYTEPHVNFDVGETVFQGGRESFRGGTIHVGLTD
jgi:hypothetical protein